MSGQVRFHKKGGVSDNVRKATDGSAKDYCFLNSFGISEPGSLSLHNYAPVSGGSSYIWSFKSSTSSSKSSFGAVSSVMELAAQ